MEENTTPNTTNSKLIPVVIAVFALLIIGGGAFYYLSTSNNQIMNTNNTNTTMNETENTAEDPNTAISLTEDEIKTFKVTGDNFKFDVNEIRVKKGDTVRIEFTNSSGMHDWVIDEFAARTKILEEGMSETIEFMADKAGTFKYYCSVGNHRAMGMVGNLIVEE